MRLPDAIIAGTNKAGTTSLFRYLTDHPQVCGSSLKETSFFSRCKGKPTPDGLATYSGYFSHCPEGALLIEASPNYLFGGRAVAEGIRNAVPDARLIFLLRDPVSRLLSFFARNQGRDSPITKGLSLARFIDLAIEADRKPADALDEATNQVVMRLQAGRYGPLLRQYLSVFPAERCHITFFDDFAASPLDAVRSVGTFLGIDTAWYDNYSFSVENKTRAYRLRWLHKLAFNTNRRLEPVLNRVPGARRAIRGAYNLLNEQGPAICPIETAVLDRLSRYYEPYNSELFRLMEEWFPTVRLPAWVAEPATTLPDTRYGVA
jgi:hypothetical protein